MELASLLQDLGYPIPPDREPEAWVHSHLLTPSEARLRTIHWLFERFDPSFRDFMTPESSDIIGLLKAAILIGICEETDGDVIKGTATPEKQLQFLTALAQLVVSVQPKAKSLASDIKRDGDLLESIASEAQNDLFTSECQLFPPDIQEILLDSQQNRTSRNLKTHKEELLDGLAMESALLEELLSALNQKLPEIGGENVDEGVIRMMEVNISSFIQLGKSFIRSFEAEFKPNLQPPVNVTNDLGPTSREVASQFAKVQQIVINLSSILDTSNNLANVNERFERSIRSGDDTHRALESIQQFASVMENSLKRYSQQRG